MKTPLKVLTFGVVRGLVWSVVPSVLVICDGVGWFSATSDVTAKALSSVLTGVVISFALGVPLKKFGKRATILLGALSLPVGAFLYGFIFSIVQWIFLGGEPAAPFEMGYACAIVSVVTPFGILFVPAIVTTFLLERVIAPVKPDGSGTTFAS